jgi:hypothetical protein
MLRLPDDIDPPKRRRTRTKRNRLNNNNTNTDPNNDKNNNSKNIRGSAQVQLKRIVDLVCDKASEHETMHPDDTKKLLKQIRRLSFTKKET